MELNLASHLPPELVVIGASWGGLAAVSRLLERLPRVPPFALALVQHRGPNDSPLAGLLSRHTDAPVHEAEDKMPIRAGTVYVAPPAYHLLVERGGFALSLDAPVRYSRPSIDVLFESAADVYGARLVGVLLTGANDDGARGLARISERGGVTMVEDPETATRPDMPRAALARVHPDVVAPVDGIADALVALGRAAPTRQDRGMQAAPPEALAEEGR